MPAERTTSWWTERERRCVAASPPRYMAAGVTGRPLGDPRRRKPRGSRRLPWPARAAAPREDTTESEAIEEHGSKDAARRSSLREIEDFPLAARIRRILATSRESVARSTDSESREPRMRGLSGSLKRFSEHYRARTLPVRRTAVWRRRRPRPAGRPPPSCCRCRRRPARRRRRRACRGAAACSGRRPGWRRRCR